MNTLLKVVLSEESTMVWNIEWCAGTVMSAASIGLREGHKSMTRTRGHVCGQLFLGIPRMSEEVLDHPCAKRVRTGAVRPVWLHDSTKMHDCPSNTPEWLALRASFAITASKVADLFNLRGAYGTYVGLLKTLTSSTPPSKPNGYLAELMNFGSQNEPWAMTYCREWYPNLGLVPAYCCSRNLNEDCGPVIGATPDMWSTSSPTLFEIKCTVRPLPDYPRPHHVMQCFVQMWVTGATSCHLVYFSQQDMKAREFLYILGSYTDLDQLKERLASHIDRLNEDMASTAMGSNEESEYTLSRRYSKSDLPDFLPPRCLSYVSADFYIQQPFPYPLKALNSGSAPASPSGPCTIGIDPGSCNTGFAMVCEGKLIKAQTYRIVAPPGEYKAEDNHMMPGIRRMVDDHDEDFQRAEGVAIELQPMMMPSARRCGYPNNNIRIEWTIAGYLHAKYPRLRILHVHPGHLRSYFKLGRLGHDANKRASLHYVRNELNMKKASNDHEADATLLALYSHAQVGTTPPESPVCLSD